MSGRPEHAYDCKVAIWSWFNGRDWIGMETFIIEFKARGWTAMMGVNDINWLVRHGHLEKRPSGRVYPSTGRESWDARALGDGPPPRAKLESS